MDDHVTESATRADTWLSEEPLTPQAMAEDIERFEDLSTAVNSFRSVLATQNLQGLVDVLAPDVVLVSDGGGLQQTALLPVVGADNVIRYIADRVGREGSTFSCEPTTVGGNPGLVLRVEGVIDGVLAVRANNARVTGLYYVRNPKVSPRGDSTHSRPDAVPP